MSENLFEAIIRHYDRYHRARAQEEAAWFVRQPTLREAIHHAALARNSMGNRFDHQRRLKPADLRKAEESLLAAEHDIEQCITFDELYKRIHKQTAHIWQNADLYCYDTALRIGAKLGLKPRKVYLHCGTRTGARNLRIRTSTGTLETSAFPEGLRQLEPKELEDILCIYKDKLQAICAR